MDEAPLAQPSEHGNAPPVFDLLLIEAKITQGQKLTVEERKFYKEATKEPVSLDELEDAQNMLLKRLCKQAQSLPAKEIPKVLEIIKTAVSERKARGDKGGDSTKAKEPTREEMLAMVQGRRA